MGPHGARPPEQVATEMGALKVASRHARPDKGVALASCQALELT